MKLARGFKSYCERTVSALRAELAVHDDAPVDMDLLANHLHIPVQALGMLLSSSGHSRADPGIDEIYRKVSAFTVFDGPKRTIIFNEEHAAPRHRSNLAHELAHALLQHPPRDSGLGVIQEDVHEEEAAWMGGVLMLTAGQARRIASSGMSFIEAALKYKLSSEMLRFRLNVTGAGRVSAG